MTRRPLLVLTTVPSAQKAERLAKILLQARCAACINILPQGDSWYWWKGKRAHSRERLLFIKTTRNHLQKLTHVLKLQHPYEVPELIALPMVWGERRYLQWLEESLQKP